MWHIYCITSLQTKAFRAACCRVPKGLPRMENMERYRPYIIAGAIVLAIFIIAFVVVATIFGWWPVVVDIVLVVTALLSLIMLGALTYATVVLIRTIQGTRDEIMPVLESLKATTSTVQATA